MSDEFKELQEHAPDTKVAPAQGIAAIALSMALKYHDISTVQDGELYQQYKLEGKNMTPLHLDMVFETAIKMEAYLLGASERIAKIVVESLEASVEDDPKEGDDDGQGNERSGS
jgi:hypothetical protein